MQSVHETLKMEDILEKNRIPYRTVAKPRSLGTECGVVLRIDETDIPRIRELAQKHGCGINGIYKKQNNHYSQCIISV